MFQAVNQLCSHFEAYRDIPKITELREKFKSIKQVLKSHVFSDFSRCVLETLVMLLLNVIGKYFLEKKIWHFIRLALMNLSSYPPW